MNNLQLQQKMHQQQQKHSRMNSNGTNSIDPIQQNSQHHQLDQNYFTQQKDNLNNFSNSFTILQNNNQNQLANQNKNNQLNVKKELYYQQQNVSNNRMSTQDHGGFSQHNISSNISIFYNEEEIMEKQPSSSQLLEIVNINDKNSIKKAQNLQQSQQSSQTSILINNNKMQSQTQSQSNLMQNLITNQSKSKFNIQECEIFEDNIQEVAHNSIESRDISFNDKNEKLRKIRNQQNKLLNKKQPIQSQNINQVNYIEQKQLSQQNQNTSLQQYENQNRNMKQNNLSTSKSDLKIQRDIIINSTTQNRDHINFKRSNSPDQLVNEHSNSVQEPILKDNIDFNNSFYSKQNHKDSTGSGFDTTQNQNNSRNENGNINNFRRQIQFHTQSNFYPSSGGSNSNSQFTFKLRSQKQKQTKQSTNDQQQQQALLPLKQKTQKQYLENMKSRIKQQYHDQIQEESGEDNNLYTEDETCNNKKQKKNNVINQSFNDFNQNNKTLISYLQQSKLEGTPSGQPVMNRRKKIQQQEVTPKSIQNIQNYCNQSSLANTNINQTMYHPNNSTIGITINHNIGTEFGGFNSTFLEKQKFSQYKNMENSYTDNSSLVYDRSASNRTPLLDHQGNSSLSRNLNQFLKNNSNNTSSVPRPTLASEIKLLKEQTRIHQGVNADSKLMQDKFLHSNNLANFMWNKEQSPKTDKSRMDRVQSNQGSRVRRDYNVHDDSVSAVRPITRSNQRRPVSRQVNQTFDSGINIQKMTVQQQMRNTHFGDGGFGFGAKSKAEDLSKITDRKVSRKRGTKVTVQQDQINIQSTKHQEIRDSIIQHQSQGTQQQQTFNNQQQPVQIIQKQNTQCSQNNEHISTQGSSGQHFYQANNLLNKSIESTSTRSIMINAKQQLYQNQSKLQQINESINDEQVNDNSSKASRSKNKIFQQMANTNYGDTSVFQNIQNSVNIKKVIMRQKGIIDSSQNMQLSQVNQSQIQNQQIQQDQHQDMVTNSHNVTQDQFFPNRNKNTNFKNHNKINLQTQNEPQFEQNQFKNKIKNNIIKEDQVKENDDDDQPYNSKKDNFEHQQSNSSIQTANQIFLGQQTVENNFRVINMVGGNNKIFNQTKENQIGQIKNNEYNNTAYMNIPNNAGNRSLPRNTVYQSNQIYNDLNESNSNKATSSTSSLTISQNNMNFQNSQDKYNNFQSNQNQNRQDNSVSPKPYQNNAVKIDQQKVNLNFTSTGFNNQSQLNNNDTLQEIQKEVNIMYLGAKSKKKFAAGMKLNPISRNLYQSNANGQSLNSQNSVISQNSRVNNNLNFKESNSYL